MGIINFGSINIDHVYRVDHMVARGETIASSDYAIHGGGKGANQSLAIAKAGGVVVHVGKVGREGEWLVDNMKRAGVDVARTVVCDKPSGHAIIQVDKDGQNAIVVHGGTNQLIGRAEIDDALASATEADMVLLQNEISNVPYVISKAAERKVPVCFNPAPISGEVPTWDLSGVSILVVNEPEGQALSGQTEPEQILAAMTARYPRSHIVLTLGSHGVVYGQGTQRLSVKALKVKAVDTTGAGDTFIGYLLAGLQRQMPFADSLNLANKAAAISVTRKGAAPSIPTWDEVGSWRP
jgi:ribokinase